MSEKIFDVIILGSGPAGLTAALYISRANLKPLVIAGSKWGGQLMLTTEVENYPGFENGILGPELMEKMRAQAEKFGAKFVAEDTTKVDFKDRPFKVNIGEKEYLGNAVIIATGASARWLEIPGEEKLIGRGVSSCAPCDAPFFRDKKVIVVGGGDAAMEEALALTKFASKVTIVHRRDEFRASKIMLERARANLKIAFIVNTTVTEVLGEEKVTGVKLKNVKTGEEKVFDCDGMFVAIGHNPATAIFAGQIDLDEKGYIKVADHTKTNIEGVFAAGDVHDWHYRQVVTAAGFGCMAAMDAEKWSSNKL